MLRLCKVPNVHFPEHTGLGLSRPEWAQAALNDPMVFNDDAAKRKKLGSCLLTW